MGYNKELRKFLNYLKKSDLVEVCSKSRIRRVVSKYLGDGNELLLSESNGMKAFHTAICQERESEGISIPLSGTVREILDFGVPVNFWEMQNLLFLCQGHSLSALGMELFPEQFRKYEKCPGIRPLFRCLDDYKNWSEPLEKEDFGSYDGFSEEELDVIGTIAREYLGTPLSRMRRITQTLGWSEAQNNCVIPKPVIAEAFRKNYYS